MISRARESAQEHFDARFARGGRSSMPSRRSHHESHAKAQTSQPRRRWRSSSRAARARQGLSRSPAVCASEAPKIERSCGLRLAESSFDARLARLPNDGRWEEVRRKTRGFTLGRASPGHSMLPGGAAERAARNARCAARVLDTALDRRLDRTCSGSPASKITTDLALPGLFA
jgi:hypothetical protein